MTEPDDPESQPQPGLIGGMIGRVAPVVMRQIDMDAIVELLDVNAIAQRLDLDALMERLDMDAIVEQLDVDAVAGKLDLDALMERLDMDAIVEQLDVNAVAGKLDLDALMKRVDMAQLTAGATQDVALSGLDLFRRQLVRADRSVDSLVGRLLRRDPGSRPEAPRQLSSSALTPELEDDTEVEVAAAGTSQRQSISGHFAGPVTRILSLIGDLTGALALFGFFSTVMLQLFSTITGVDATLDPGGWLPRTLLAAWLLAWFWIPVALFGRTITMALVGVAVVDRSGDVAKGRQALIRALVLPISITILALGLIGMVLGRERRTLHDVAAGTVVVHDWGAREAEQPVTLGEQLSARVSRRKSRSLE